MRCQDIKKPGLKFPGDFSGGEELVQLVVAEQRCAVFEQRERFGLHLRKVLARQRGGFLLKLASIQGGSTILPNWATRRMRAGADATATTQKAQEERGTVRCNASTGLRNDTISF